jgi:hypothetical protein
MSSFRSDSESDSLITIGRPAAWPGHAATLTQARFALAAAQFATRRCRCLLGWVPVRTGEVGAYQ